MAEKAIISNTKVDLPGGFLKNDESCIQAINLIKEKDPAGFDKIKILVKSRKGGKGANSNPDKILQRVMGSMGGGIMAETIVEEDVVGVTPLQVVEAEEFIPPPFMPVDPSIITDINVLLEEAVKIKDTLQMERGMCSEILDNLKQALEMKVNVLETPKANIIVKTIRKNRGKKIL